MVEQPESDEYVPTMKLRLFTQALLSEEVKGNKSKAERITGIRRDLFLYNLKKNPDFKEWYRKQVSNIFEPFIPAIGYALLKSALTGDNKVALRIMEEAGIFDKEEQHTTVNLNQAPPQTFIFKDLGLEDGNETGTDSPHAVESSESNRLDQTV